MSKFKSGNGSNKNDVYKIIASVSFSTKIGKKSPNLRNHVLGIKCSTKFPWAAPCEKMQHTNVICNSKGAFIIILVQGAWAKGGGQKSFGCL